MAEHTVHLEHHRLKEKHVGCPTGPVLKRVKKKKGMNKRNGFPILLSTDHSAAKPRHSERDTVPALLFKVPKRRATVIPVGL